MLQIMELTKLYELQFTSYLAKDAANVVDEALEWQTLCFCFSEPDLKSFIHSLEMIDSFKNQLCPPSFSDEFSFVYRYRYVPVDKKLLVL